LVLFLFILTTIDDDDDFGKISFVVSLLEISCGELVTMKPIRTGP